jgi:hypothetical protein
MPMAKFARTLRPQALKTLRRLAEAPGQNWWKDLLALWSPSGTVAGVDGLRLAVRKNYLNFYLRGQSIARVGFTIAGEPFVETHVKYAFGPAENAQAYARLKGTEIWRGNAITAMNYNGATTLGEWISRAQKHIGSEKRCVDDLLAQNPSIIDLEMGLPADGERKTAQRIDFVALEQCSCGLQIVFWEAKLADDSRLRSRSQPEVLNQLRIYKSYLEDIVHAEGVKIAYRTVCQVLFELHAMVPGLPPLSPLVTEAAKPESHLEVDPLPRLVIFGGKEYQKKANWDFHLSRLRTWEIPCLVLESGPYRLSRPQGTA